MAYWSDSSNMLLFISKLLAIIRRTAVSVGVYFDCIVAGETRVSVLCFERGAGWLALLRGPALLLSVVPVKVMRGSLYHRLSAVSDAIE